MKTAIGPLLLRLVLFILGAAAGAVMTVCLTVAYHAIVSPGILDDGLYRVILYFLVPLGGVLGGVTGIVRAYLGIDRELGLRIARIGGWLSLEMVCLLAIFYSGGASPVRFLTTLAGIFLIPLAWSVLLIIGGFTPSGRAPSGTTSRQT